MANRRMFSKDITSSEEFLEMPDSTQKLYFHLVMNADDDGFVQPKGIMRMVRCGEDDLKILTAKGFVIMFNGNVIVITQWKINNEIRVDRYKPTIYQEHLKTLSLDENKAYIKGKILVVPTVVPVGNHLDTQYRLGKVRLEEPVVENDDTISYEETDEEGNVIKRKKPKPPSKVAPAKVFQKFDYKAELQKLRDSRIKADKIIAQFFYFKGYEFENGVQMQSVVKRNSRVAKSLEGYTGGQIKKTMEFCEEDSIKNKYDWGLETVAKKIPNIINKKNG